ncbi:hypothetical protein [Roseivirga sp. UBA1976]|uniref:hypothetical protein n=1 Tax=Roseivirga sp. UBA1976 TaxID=1947386 RepID=UPI00258103FD|nr:hypothetical protein [Roseivirga sp. UBA1976]
MKKSVPTHLLLIVVCALTQTDHKQIFVVAGAALSTQLRFQAVDVQVPLQIVSE